jgi:hypothetical protein
VRSDFVGLEWRSPRAHGVPLALERSPTNWVEWVYPFDVWGIDVGDVSGGEAVDLGCGREEAVDGGVASVQVS